MKSEIVQRERFLLKSLDVLEKKQADLNDILQKKIAEIQNDVMMARRIRKENLLIPSEIKASLSSADETLKKDAEKALQGLQEQENQIVQKYIQDAVNHPEKGKEVRNIAAQIQDNGLRVKQMKAELEQIKRLY